MQRYGAAPVLRVPLNDANFDLEVNFYEYWEHAPDGSVIHFS